MGLLLKCVLLSTTFSVACSANILGICNFQSKSHALLLSTLLKQLVQHGHNITMIGPYPIEKNAKNFKNVVTLIDANFNNAFNVRLKQAQSLYQEAIVIESMSRSLGSILNQSVVRDIVTSNRTFDLVIIDYGYNTANLGLSHLFKAPAILFSTFGTFTELEDITQIPTPYSHVPYAYLKFSNRMNFWQRLTNAIHSLIWKFYEWIFDFKIQKELLGTYFPKAPALVQLYDKVGLVLMNTHFSIEGPKPYVPIIRQITGFHVQKSMEIDKDLEVILDSAKEGIIYFSFGTNLKSDHIPPAVIRNIIDGLSKIPLKVLWKWTRSDSSALPENIIIREWLPQHQILSHPNTKLFITHGGLNSITESLYFGIPVLGIPIFADQFKNIQTLVDAKCGMKLLRDDITAESISQAINTILRNSSYKETTRKYGAVLKDYPVTPADRAVFWIEYTLKHKESKFLKSPASELNFFEYHMLDIYISFILSLLIAFKSACLVLTYIVDRVIQAIRRK